MNLLDFTTKPHPSKAIFKAHKIGPAAVASALDLSYGYVVTILNGTRNATPEIDLKLRKLASSLNEPKVADKESAPLLVIRIGATGIVETEIHANNEDDQITVQRIKKSIEYDLEMIKTKLQKMAA